MREYNLKRKGYSTGNRCLVDDCDEDSRARGRCKKHYKAWGRENGMVKAEPWNDRKRDNAHRRRARLYGYTHADRQAMLSQVIERDGNTCTWCNKPVDLTLKWPNKMYKSLDHTLALSLGGEHSLDNATLMHHSCNASKGARVAS